MPASEDKPRAARLLKGAALFVLLAGGGLLAWLMDKALRHPEIQARQFGRFGEAVPLWLPLTLFVLLFVAGAAYLFWRAGRRVENGQDLFARRHRRHPREKNTDPSADAGQ